MVQGRDFSEFHYFNCMNVNTQAALSPWRFLKYASAFTIPLVVALSFLAEGAWTWIAIGYGFGLLPLLELVLPSSAANLTEAEREVVQEDRIYDALLWSMVVIQYVLLGWFLFELNAGTRELWSMEWWGLCSRWAFRAASSESTWPTNSDIDQKSTTNCFPKRCW